jgi:hypothetical protein
LFHFWIAPTLQFAHTTTASLPHTPSPPPCHSPGHQRRLAWPPEPPCLAAASSSPSHLAPPHSTATSSLPDHLALPHCPATSATSSPSHQRRLHARPPAPPSHLATGTASPDPRAPRPDDPGAATASRRLTCACHLFTSRPLSTSTPPRTPMRS